MTVYVALLRAVNVSGHNKMKMADLKIALEDMGLGNVQTYIQSGNVVFTSEDEPGSMRTRLEQVIEDRFGLHSTVVLRTAAEWEQIIEDCPYKAVALGEKESIHVSVLTEAPSEPILQWMDSIDRGRDEYLVHGREVYFLFHQSILDSKLAKSMQKLGDIATSRNWNTVNKLAVMARALK